MFKKLFWGFLFFYIFIPLASQAMGYDLQAWSKSVGVWMENVVSPLYWMGKIPGLKDKGLFVNAMVFLLIWWRIRFWKRKIKKALTSEEEKN